MPRSVSLVMVWTLVLLSMGLLAGELLIDQRPRHASQDGTPVTLTLYRYFGGCADEYAGVTDVGDAVGECGIIQVLTNQFNAEHAGAIAVRTQTAEWSGYYDRLSASYAARRPPDIAVMNQSALPSYVSRELVRPLGASLAAAGVAFDDVIPLARQGVTFNSEVYALPYDVHGLLWHLNLDLLAEAGLTDERGPILPSNPEELMAQARLVRAKTGKAYLAIPSQTDPMPTWTIESWIWQQQARLISVDGRTAMLDTPDARRALRLLASLYEEGHANPGLDYAGAEQAFLNGEAAVLINGTWVVESYYTQAARQGTVLRHYAPRTPPQLFAVPAAWTDGHVWVLPRQERDDERTDKAAVIFLTYLFERSEAWARTGHLPARQSVLDSAAVRRLPGRDQYLDIARVAKAFPSVERHRAIQDTLAGHINATWLASQAPEQALRGAQEDVQRILSKKGQ